MLRNPAYAGTAVFGKTMATSGTPGLNRVARESHAGCGGWTGEPTRSNPGRAPRSHPTQVVIHQQGWTLVLNPGGTTTARNKDKTKVLHSHGPPARAG